MSLACADTPGLNAALMCSFPPLPPLQVIVSTDVMARGVDLDRVNVVANLDVPYDSATYVHRSAHVCNASLVQACRALYKLACACRTCCMPWGV